MRPLARPHPAGSDPNLRRAVRSAEGSAWLVQCDRPTFGLWDDPAMGKTPETPMARAVHIKWADAVAEHDYTAAEAYLSLKLNEDGVAKAVRRLRKAPLTTRRANDILRAAGLTAAPLDDPGVMKDLIRAIEGVRLSPVLLLSGKKRADIADGFHRVSLVYRVDPYATVPLKIG
jgi:hypothetical protein